MCVLDIYLPLQDANGGGGGLIAYQDPDADGVECDNGRRLFLPFEGTDVKGRTGRLNKGDPVTFLVATDARTGKRHATQVGRLTLLLSGQSRSPDVLHMFPYMWCLQRDSALPVIAVVNVLSSLEYRIFWV